MTTIQRSVSIPIYQDSFLREYNLSVSKLLQKAINEQMEELGFRKNLKASRERREKGKFITKNKKEFLNELENW